MTQLDEKTRGIATQVAAKIASDFVIQGYRHDDQANITEMIGDFISTLDLVNEALLGKMGEDSLGLAFPTATFQPEAPAEWKTEPFVHEQNVSPAPIPGATEGKDDALWRRYFQDPSKWWDNRKDKRNPRAPDFKLKDDGDVALWIVGRDTPAWVATRLGGY